MPDMAKEAYVAYAKALLRFTGEAPPQWDDLSRDERSAWDAAAQAVMAVFD